MLDQLANGDETKYEYFENLNVYHFLNLLTFKIEKAEHEKRMMELERLKHKMR